LIFSRSCDCGGSESLNPFTVSMFIFIFLFSLFAEGERTRKRVPRRPFVSGWALR
jgi:hypothetical protein